MTKIIKFSDIKEQLSVALTNKIHYLNLSMQQIIIMEGFANCPLSMELSDSIVIGGSKLPMIVVGHQQTGQIYFFALRSLLPNIDQ